MRRGPIVTLSVPIVASSLIGCTAPGGPDAGTESDGGSSARLDAGPPERAPVPEWGEACFEGWCFEMPRALGPIRAVEAVSDDELWVVVDFLSLGGGPRRAFRIRGHEIEASPVPLGSGPSSVRLRSAGPDDVWIRDPDAEPWLWHFDGTAWTPVPDRVWMFDRIGAGRVLALDAEAARVWDGSSWTTYPLPAALLSTPERNVALDELAGSADGHGFFRATVTTFDPAADGPSYAMTREIWHWDGASFERLPIDLPGGSLFAFSGTDLWIGGSHWIGGHLEARPDTYASVVGGSPDDVWATGGGHALHWDGVTFSPTDDFFEEGLIALSAASAHPWALDGRGTLQFFDGVAWQRASTPPAAEQLTGIAAASGATGPAVWAVNAGGSFTSGVVESFVLARDDEGLWSAIDDTRSEAGALRQVFARTSDDVWAFGQQVMHLEGGLWQRTPITVGATTDGTLSVLSDLCATDATHAWASAPSGRTLRIHAWTGAWAHEGRVDAGDMGPRDGSLRCFPSGAVWAFAGPTIAERADGRWRATPPLESLWILGSFAPSGERIFAATSRGLLEWNGLEWSFDPLDALAPDDVSPRHLEAIAGSSETDVFFVWGSPDRADRTRQLVHHDGTRVDRPATALEGLGGIAGLGVIAPDDVIVIDVRGRVLRVDHGSVATVAPASSMIVSRAVVLARDDAWGVAEDGRVWHFDGAAWTPLATAPGVLSPWASDVVAFATDDVWAVGAGGVAHYDGAVWSEEPIPAIAGASSPRLGGRSASELWIGTATSSMWTRRGGTWEARSLSSLEEPIHDVRFRLGAPDDAWVLAGHAPSGSIVSWLYHDDGASLTPYAAPSWVTDLREVDGHLLALAASGVRTQVVLERAGGRWIERSDLDVADTFPVETSPIGGWRARAGDTRWVANGSVILRHDP